MVEAPLPVRLAAAGRARAAAEQARARIAAQATDEQRRAIADEVIVNDGDLAELRGRRSTRCGPRLQAASGRARDRSWGVLGRTRRIGESDRVIARHEFRADADVAQLVAHHLAKVRVAGSNPVVRSRSPSTGIPGQGSRIADNPAAWPSGLGKGLQSPVRGFDSRRRLEHGTTTASHCDAYITGD